MEIRFSTDLLDPHEYDGMVFNMPEERIPGHLEQRQQRHGTIELWKDQAFTHHYHPGVGKDEFSFLEEPVLAKEWASILSAKFPHHKFIVEIDPLYLITWYQAIDDAPTEDEEEFTLHSSLHSFGQGQSEDQLKVRAKTMTIKEFNDKHNHRKERLGFEGPCEKCGGSEGYSEPYVSPDHRGVRLMQCLACGSEIVHSFRTVRNKVGF